MGNVWIYYSMIGNPDVVLRFSTTSLLELNDVNNLGKKCFSGFFMLWFASAFQTLDFSAMSISCPTPKWLTFILVHFKLILVDHTVCGCAIVYVQSKIWVPTLACGLHQKVDSSSVQCLFWMAGVERLASGIHPLSHFSDWTGIVYNGWFADTHTI